jgi:glycosyltransferase involved in cell wall biosynthesis
MQSNTVQILLATYNGERFIREQLDSLLNQTEKNFTVIIRDDGSTDHTLDIIAEYQVNYPDTFTLLQDNTKNKSGAKGNFAMLLEKSTADYVFFCDQDDVWLPEKVEMELEKIQWLENKDRSNPCMVFSDMKIINEDGMLIGNSLWCNLHLHPDFFVLHRLLVQNIPHGCSMVINKALRNLAYPIPEAAIMHDHWIALLVATCGSWDAITTPTLLIRNHGENVTRHKTSLLEKIKRFTSNMFSKEQYESFLQIRIAQATALLSRCQEILHPKQIAILNDFIALSHVKGIERKKIILKHKFFRTTWWHTLKMVMRA